MNRPGDPDFEQRRLAARARLDAIDDAGKSDPYRRAWFEAVYESAGSDAAQIPWADLSPHPLLAAWLAGAPAPAPGARALDIGCGLGDNAAAISAKGWRTTAFDLSPRAIRWAQSRFPQVGFLAADLFRPPASNAMSSRRERIRCSVIIRDDLTCFAATPCPPAPLAGS